MAFKKIILENCTCCPKCKGVKGVTRFLQAKVKMSNFWGNSAELFKDEKVTVPKQNIRTATCDDCGQRFELI